MEIVLFSFLGIFLFIVHEFDEIILIRPWIEANAKSKAFQNEMFIKKKDYYLSTESIALMILEELILAMIIILAAIIFKIPELSLAIIVCHTAHLVLHIIQVVKFGIFVPGGITSVFTMPFLLIIICLFWAHSEINILLFIILCLVIMGIIIWNLYLLHKNASKVENFIKNIVKRKAKY